MDGQAQQAAPEQRPAAPARARMWPLTAVLVGGWLGLTGILLATMRPGMEGPSLPWALALTADFGLLVVLPALAGAVIAGWREGADDPRQPLPSRTPLLAWLGGLALNWLNVLVLWGWEVVRFPGQDMAKEGVMRSSWAGLFGIVGLGGALLGGIGCGLWGLLARRQGLRLYPR
ncbi:MAG TPA: hypothetical protein VH257_14820 [Chloroflexota bacterium]|nr:hypothetical protein [Chloroflexota bacterium]